MWRYESLQKRLSKVRVCERGLWSRISVFLLAVSTILILPTSSSSEGDAYASVLHERA